MNENTLNKLKITAKGCASNVLSRVELSMVQSKLKTKFQLLGQKVYEAIREGRLDEIKAYLDDNSAASVAISGYNDTTGDAAANAALARERAEAVRDALVAAGIPAGRITLDKPRQATESKDTLAESRRVDVRVTQK